MPRLKDGFRGERAIIMPRMAIEQMENDPLMAVLHVTDMGYYPHATHHYRKRSEGISQHILIYCIEGAGWCTVDGVKHLVKANQFIILPKGMPHEYGADEANPWTIYWIHFKGHLAADYISNEVLPVVLNPSMHSRILQRINLFEEIFSTLKMGFSRDNLRYACSMFHHFLGSLCYWVQYCNAVNHSEKGMIESVIHFMNEHIECKPTLADMAAFTGYSTSHFSALFCEATGMSPVAYFNQLRIRRACELLDFTDMKINQVCFKVGIEDPYYFSRLFKRIMGVSPREFRMIEKG